MKVNDVERNIHNLKSIVQNSSTAQDAINLYLKTGKILTHGRTNGNVDGFQVVKNKENRQPTNTPQYIHDYIDTVIEHTTGYPYRSASLFAYMDSIPSTVSGRHFVIPIGETFNMMSIPYVVDFYHTIYDNYYRIAKRVTQIVSDKFELSDKAWKSIEMGILTYLEDDMMGDDDKTIFIVHAIKEISPELKEYLFSDEFEKLIRKKLFDACDNIIKDATVYNDTSTFNQFDDEEVHVHSEIYVLVGREWFINEAKNEGIDEKGLWESLL